MLILLHFPIYVVTKTCKNIFKPLIKFNMSKIQFFSSLDRQPLKLQDYLGKLFFFLNSEH